MKRHLLMLVVAALLSAASFRVAADKVVEFYFLDPYSLTGSPESLMDRYASGDENKFKWHNTNKWIMFLTGENIVVDGVVMTASTPGTKPRLYFVGGDTDDDDDIFFNDFRCYSKNKISLAAPAGSRIRKVVMHGKAKAIGKSNNCDEIKVDASCGGTQTQNGGINTWVADGDGLSKVSYTVTTGANTQAMYRMFVTLTGSTGIDDVETEADDEDAPVEYYNLTGVRCNADALAPGIYIRRCGGKSTKVLIR